MLTQELYIKKINSTLPAFEKKNIFFFFYLPTPLKKGEAIRARARVSFMVSRIQLGRAALLCCVPTPKVVYLKALVSYFIKFKLNISQPTEIWT